MHSIVFLVLAAANPEILDVTEQLPSMRVWGDGKGHYIAADKGLEHIYYGDGKILYETGAFSWSSSGETAAVTLRDQRYDGQSQTEVNLLADGSMTVVCGKRTSKLALQAADKLKAVIDKASFRRGPHSFIPYALARDDKGIYYFVDKGRYPDNERSFRVFTGPRGNMKEQKLQNIVHDSGGDIFATPAGDLRLIVGSPRTTEWVREDKHTTLLDLPIEDNVQMIYNELGVYKTLRLGKPCDDL